MLLPGEPSRQSQRFIFTLDFRSFDTITVHTFVNLVRLIVTLTLWCPRFSLRGLEQRDWMTYHKVTLSLY